MPYSQKDYEEAKAALASGEIPKEHVATVQSRVAQYEDDRARGQLPAPADEGRAPSPSIDVPKPGATGFWKPNRPLGIPDYIPQDTGGNLAVWRDMPVEVYRKKVLEPQRMAAIAAGQKAMLEFQRYGANAFSPEDQVKRTMLIAQGQAAAVQDPDKVDENDPGYKQFNEQQWQQAVQQRQADPNAGPIQRLEKMSEESPLFYGTEKAKDLALPAMRGALDIGTLGLGTGALDALTEAVSGRGAVDVSRGLEAEHPVATGLGAAGMALLRPTLGSAGLASKVYGAVAPKLGRYAGAALSGAAMGAAEGLGKDLSAEGADALSGSPDAVMERGRLDPERLAINTALRAGGGAVAGGVGQGVADAGRGLADAISRASILGTAGRSPFERAEAEGFQFGPLGIKVPEMVNAEREATRASGKSWFERLSDKSARPIAQNVDAMDVGETAAMGKENLSYFNSVRDPSNPMASMAPISNTNRVSLELAQELRGVDPTLATQIRKLVHGFDPLMTPKQMGTAVKKLSGMADAAENGSDKVRADAMRSLQAAMMEDIKSLPKGNLEGRLAEGPNGETLEGWPALRAEHEGRIRQVAESRQLTGAKIPGASLPEELATINQRLGESGTSASSVARENELSRFMPPELRRELRVFSAANAIQEMKSPQGLPYPSRAGVLDAVAGRAKLAGYGLGRSLSKPPDNFPISDKMFAFMNSRIPRATMFMPGMDLTKMVQERFAMEGRPKTFKDLSPEQQQFLMTIVSPDQKEVLQENLP